MQGLTARALVILLEVLNGSEIIHIRKRKIFGKIFFGEIPRVFQYISIDVSAFLKKSSFSPLFSRLLYQNRKKKCVYLNSCLVKLPWKKGRKGRFWGRKIPSIFIPTEYGLHHSPKIYQKIFLFPIKLGFYKNIYVRLSHKISKRFQATPKHLVELRI